MIRHIPAIRRVPRVERIVRDRDVLHGSRDALVARGTGAPRGVAAFVSLAALLVAFAAAPAGAHGGHGARGALHFSHPLVGESPSPGTKVRIDHRFDSIETGGELNTARLEAEYAIRRWVSVEVDVPWTYRRRAGRPTENHLNDVEAALKLATFALADRGVLLGGGVAAELPTGDAATGIGSEDVTVVAPFVSAGLRRGALEVVGRAEFGIPTGGDASVEPDLELTWNGSALVHVGGRLMVLAEFDGAHVSGGAEDGFDAVYAAPGVKLVPLRGTAIEVGASVRVALTDERDTDISTVGSVFYHF